MATYKGIGFDNTSGKIRTATSSDEIAFDAQINATDGVVVTGDTETTTLTTTGDASIGGDLSVVGNIVSRGTQNLVVQDAMIDLGLGNSSTTATAGGYALTMNRDSGFAVETVTACTAGVIATSAPELTVSANSNFATGDVLCLTGSDDASNDGLYVVAGGGGTTTLTLEGVGGTAVSGAMPFVQNQLTQTTGDSASAFKIDLYVQVVADGTANFKDAGGSTHAKGKLLETFKASVDKADFVTGGVPNNGAYSLVGSAVSTDLQNAYVAGNSITTNGNAIDFNLANGNFTIDQGNVLLGATNATNFTMEGGAFSVGSTTPASAVELSGQTAVFEGKATSTAGSVDLNVDSSSSLTISHSGQTTVEYKETAIGYFVNTSGLGSLERDASANGDDFVVRLESAGTFDASLILESKGNGSDALTLQTITNGGDILIDSDGGITINSDELIDINGTGAVQIDANNGYAINATGVSNVSTTGANLTVSTITTGDVTVSSVGQLTLDSDDALFLKMDANSATNKVLQIQANNADVTGQANIQIDADNNIFCQIAGANVLEIAPASIIANQNLQASSSGGLKFGLAGQVVTEIDTDTTFASPSNSALATQLAIKTYVDGQIPTVDQDLNLQGDTGTGTVNLATQTLDIAGTNNQIETTASGQSVTISLPTLVNVPSNLQFNGGQQVNTISTDTGLNGGGANNNTLATQLAVKSYVDDNLNQKQDVTVLTDGSSSAISVGDVVSINGSGQAIQADATQASTANVIGICVSIDGTDISIQQIGNNKSVSGLTAGTKYYLSKTAGTLTNNVSGYTSGNIVYQIGYARSSTEIIVAPQFMMEIG